MCRKCGQWKPEDQFWKRRADGAGGLRNQCKTCGTVAAIKWQKDNPERMAAINRRSYENNRETKREYDLAHRAQNTERQRAGRQRKRQLVLDHYGRSCACCGATDQLTVDHIDGGGKLHRAEIGSFKAGHLMNTWLVKNNFPEGFQILCLSCNASKRDGPACQLRH